MGIQSGCNQADYAISLIRIGNSQDQPRRKSHASEYLSNHKLNPNADIGEKQVNINVFILLKGRGIGKKRSRPVVKKAYRGGSLVGGLLMGQRCKRVLLQIRR